MIPGLAWIRGISSWASLRRVEVFPTQRIYFLFRAYEDGWLDGWGVEEGIHGLRFAPFTPPSH